jgi:putative thioredoxin
MRGRPWELLEKMLRAAHYLRRSASASAARACCRAFSAARPPPPPPPGARAPPPPKGIIGLDGRVIAPRPPPAPPRAAPAAGGGGGGGGAPPPQPAAEPVIDVTAANFQSAVLRSPVAVILQATAAWCEPCKKLSPRLEQVARAARGALVYARLDVDANPELATQLAVRSLPTVWGLVLGKAVDTFQGLPAEERLRQFLETVISAAETAGAVPGGEGGASGGNPLEQAAAAVAGAGESVEAGRFAEALAPLRGILTSLQGVEQGFRDAQAAEQEKLAAAAPAPPPGSPAAAAAARLALKRKAINPVPREIQELGARTLAFLGAWG